VRVLNLYAGIGGNRKLWQDVEVTAVENNPFIAEIYHDFFPNDKIIVGDAHQYLLDHFEEYDFIWSSPPCPTHSRINTLLVTGRNLIKARYPDMKLYEEIVFLKHWYKKGNWVVENVRSYYKPLIEPQEIGRHYFWTNFIITKFVGKWKMVRNNKGNTLSKKMADRDTFINNFHGYGGDKRTLLSNMIEPELGFHILNESKRDLYPELFR